MGIEKIILIVNIILFLVLPLFAFYILKVEGVLLVHEKNQVLAMLEGGIRNLDLLNYGMHLIEVEQVDEDARLVYGRINFIEGLYMDFLPLSHDFLWSWEWLV